jgi:hypothetical protein
MRKLVMVSLLLAMCSACRTVHKAVAPEALPKNESGYYAVLLDNNQVVYGKLQGIGTAYPVLTEVHFVRTTVDKESKQVSTALVKRGMEPHEPDHMIVNAAHIVVIEPVGMNSRIASVLRGADTPK